MKRFNERKNEYFNALERLNEALECEIDDVVIVGIYTRRLRGM